MKLTDFSLAVLKNFSTINDGIVLRQGSTIKTMSAEESIWGEAEVDDVFPVEFGIDDLNNFLGNITTLGNPELTFSNKSVLLDDGTFSINYRATPPDLIDAPPAGKKIKIDTPDVTFDLPKDTLSKLLKLAAMNGLDALSVIGQNSNLLLQTHDKHNKDSNNALMTVGPFTGADFQATFKTDNLKMMPDDYVVDLKKGAFARFASKTRKITYYIALEVK
jgi:hypothetical protein